MVSFAMMPAAEKPGSREGVALRQFPYPYRAALAICSDIDETRSVEEFLEIQQFLNTKDMTSMGEGVGLEIGNSFYFYDNDREFSYFTHEPRAQPVIADFIRAGYIDCLHSYGDAANSRHDIERALTVLHGLDCKLQVWINHSRARNNFCRKFEYFFGQCLGDDPASDVYHADLTLDYGIRFAWVGASTRMVGQSARHSPAAALRTVYDPRYPGISITNVGKEIGKKALGVLQDSRFHLQHRNKLMQVTELEDGQKVFEFIRYCNHPEGVPLGATSRGLAYVISPRTLDMLKAAHGYMIVYTHLGKNADSPHYIAPETQAALRNLETEYRTGSIYVTTTFKLVSYYHTAQYLIWDWQAADNQMQIFIRQLDDPIQGQVMPTADQLQGITFYVPDKNRVQVYLGNTMIEQLQRNPADESGMESVTLPFTQLRFPYSSQEIRQLAQ